jgi:hypothetical protein
MVRSASLLFKPSSNDETFLTLSFGVEDKPNNNNFNNFFLKSLLHHGLAYDFCESIC